MDKRERAVAARIAGEVRAKRSARGWSQAALAGRLELSTNYVSMIERAERLPSVEVLVRLGATLGASVGTLVGEAPAEADPWIEEAVALVRAVPENAREVTMAMLRGAASVR